MKSLSNSTDEDFDTIYVNSIVPSGGSNINIAGNLVISDTITVDTANVSTLSSNDSFITLAKSILPNSNNTISIGNNALRLNTIHNVRNFIPNDDAGTSFSSTSSITLFSGVNTSIALNISSPQFDDTGGLYSFKIPQKGYYIMSFSVSYDTGAGSNWVEMWIYNGVINEDQQYATFNTNGLTPSNITFSFWANSLSDKFDIYAKSISVNVTNFKIEWGRLMCAASHE
jgi:hypothetical protein